MLSSHLLHQDINSLCELIDKNSLEEDLEQYDNFSINESLSYIRQSFIPYLIQNDNKMFENNQI